MYPLFLLNIIFAGLTGMLRGPLFALGLMPRLTPYILAVQGCGMPVVLWLLLSGDMGIEGGMNGIWAAKVATEIVLLGCSGACILRADWH